MHRTLSSLSRWTLGACAALTVADGAAAQVAWSQAQTTNAPPPFCGSAWDEQRGVLVAFGGSIGGVPVSTMREWDGTTWTNLSPTPRPTQRGRPAMAYDAARGETVLFGGSPIPTPETWTWDGVAWTQKAPATQPSVRFGAAAAYDRVRQVVVLFGGFVPSGQDANDVWEWDGANWAQRTPAGGSPTPRGAHRMVWDASRQAVLVVGGFSTPQNNTLADVWSWNGTSWSQEPPLPGTLCDQAMCYDPTRGRVVLNGGLRITNGAQTDQGDTLELDTQWTMRAPTTPPIARSATAAGWDDARGEFVTSGGTTAGLALLSDTWTYRPVAAATVTPYGFGCAITSGVQLEERSLPYVGLPFEQAIVGASSAVALGLVVFGGSDTSWLGTPLPLDLSVIGAPTCSLLTSVDAVLSVAITNGQGSVTWNLPSAPAAVGGAFFTQGVVIDPLSPLPFPIDATDGRRFTIGNP
jgi:hypothetical protein